MKWNIEQGNSLLSLSTTENNYCLKKKKNLRALFNSPLSKSILIFTAYFQKSRNKPELSSPYFDNHTTAAHYFARFSFSVDLAETYPFTQFLVVINLCKTLHPVRTGHL